MKKEFIVDNIEGLNNVADYIIQLSNVTKVFYLKGDLGAGKTTLVQKICKKLNTNDKVVSPSFALVNIYNSDFGEIYHIDLYRINDIEEAIDLGIEDYLYSDKFCFIEWADIIAPISPEVYFEINIKLLKNNSRHIEIVKKEN